jgi:hypothetical protein
MFKFAMIARINAARMSNYKLTREVIPIVVVKRPIRETSK